MDDMQINTDAMGTETPDAPKPIGTAPEHQSPIDRTRVLARKVLAIITGGPKS